ncbi:MAG TPA: hypothetical protein DCZ12_19155 [Gammaproteobacteria bacterium]|nr:hypothetical protein [Gammaproteobacteria bacterium]
MHTMHPTMALAETTLQELTLDKQSFIKALGISHHTYQAWCVSGIPETALFEVSILLGLDVDRLKKGIAPCEGRTGSQSLTQQKQQELEQLISEHLACGHLECEDIELLITHTKHLVHIRKQR